MSSRYEMFQNMQEEEQMGGRHKRGHKKPVRRPLSPKPRVVRKGKSSKSNKGGIDLTPFLTSLLLLSSKMAYDKRSPGKAFTSLFASSRAAAKGKRKGNRRPRKVGGYEDAVIEDFAEQQKKQQAQTDSAGMVSQVTESVSGMFDAFLPKVGAKTGGRREVQEQEQEQDGGRRGRGRKASKPKRAMSPAGKRGKSPAAKRGKSPAKKSARKHHSF
jgi:hypothetical protein